MTKSDTVPVGEINGLHGVKGWVKVFSYTRPRAQISEYSSWNIVKNGVVKTVAVKQFKESGKHLLALLDGVDSYEAAELLVGSKLEINASECVSSEDEGYFWRDLIGCEVVTVDQEPLGRVDHLLETGSNDVLVVKDKVDGIKSERYIPWLDEVLELVDLERKKIIVNWDKDF